MSIDYDAYLSARLRGCKFRRFQKEIARWNDRKARILSVLNQMIEQEARFTEGEVALRSGMSRDILQHIVEKDEALARIMYRCRCYLSPKVRAAQRQQVRERLQKLGFSMFEHV